MTTIRCERHGTVLNAAAHCFWCDREEERRKLEASMRRYDEADPEEVDSDEYQRVLTRLVAVRNELEQAPAAAAASADGLGTRGGRKA